MHLKSGTDADITADIIADTLALIDTTAYIVIDTTAYIVIDTIAVITADTAPFIDTTVSAECTVAGDVRSGDRGTETGNKQYSVE